MIPTTLTVQEFLDKLFAQLKVPLLDRGGITIAKDRRFNYPFSKWEITEYIDHYLQSKPIGEIDKVEQDFHSRMDDIIDEWYLINTGNEFGRCGYEEDLLLWAGCDSEDTGLHTWLKCYVWGKVKELKNQLPPEPQHDPEPQATLPPELDIPGAGIIFNRAIEAELMRQDGDKYKWRDQLSNSSK